MPRVFVTVGTTKFDALIENVLSENTLSVLASLGYQEIIVQYGSGKNIYFPYLSQIESEPQEKVKDKESVILKQNEEYHYLFRSKKGMKNVNDHLKKLKGQKSTEAEIQIRAYRYKNNILSDMESADLVISHAGAGSITDGLGLQKKMVVVINDTLMNNHQTEVADAFEAENYLFSTTPSNLCSLLLQKDLSELKIRPQPDTSLFPAFLGQEMGFE